MTSAHLTGLRLLCLCSDPLASITEIRLGQPLRRWCAERGATLRLLDRRTVRSEDIEHCDLLIVQRDLTAHLLGVMRHAARAGKAVVFEIDDLLTEVPDFLAHRTTPRQKRHLLEALRMADAVSTSTEALRQVWQALNPHVHLTPNCGVAPLDTGRLPRPGTGRPTVVLASSDELVLQSVAPALKHLQDDPHTPLFELVTVGPCGPRLRAMGLISRELPRLSLGEFLTLIRTIDHPIGLLPLDRSHFSQCKSAVKFFDYALAGVACIATDTPPYSAVIRHGINGLSVGDRAEDWHLALSALLADETKRRSLATQAQVDVERDHAPERSLAAWDGLVASALAQARLRGAAPGAWSRLGSAGFWRAHDVGARLSEHNRKRLARRRAVGPVAAPGHQA